MNKTDLYYNIGIMQVNIDCFTSEKDCHQQCHNRY